MRVETNKQFKKSSAKSDREMSDYVAPRNGSERQGPGSDYVGCGEVQEGGSSINQ